MFEEMKKLSSDGLIENDLTSLLRQKPVTTNAFGKWLKTAALKN